MKLTAEELRTIAEREEKATAGPWVVNNNQVLQVRTDADGYQTQICRVTPCTISSDNIHFISASRTDIPRLLAHIKELEEGNKQFAVVTTQLAGAVKKASEDFAEEGMYDHAEYYRQILKGTTP